MVSKQKIKFIRSLQIKKNRLAEQLFFVEGAKSVLELLGSEWPVAGVAATEEFIRENSTLLEVKGVELLEASEAQLVQMGTFASNRGALAWAPIPNAPESLPTAPWVLALDDIRDPGNLGTLLRIADWYGLHEIVCSTTTAELYNPKVLHASMGSFTRVKVWYQDLTEYLPASQRPVYGAYLEGDNVHSLNFAERGVLLMGNEAQGIHPDLEALVTQKVHIPQFGGAESLNVASATAVICDNLRRNHPQL